MQVFRISSDVDGFFRKGVPSGMTFSVHRTGRKRF